MSDFSNSPSAARAGLVPGWLCGAVVAGSLGLAAALIPTQRQLVSRLLEDGENQRALEVADGRGENELRLAPVEPLTPLERLRMTLTPDYRGPGAVASAAIQSAADPLACLNLLDSMEANLTADQRRPLYLAIIRSALAQDKPGLAAEVTEDAIRHGVADSVMYLSAVKAWRWADEPGKALAVFEAWRRDSPGTMNAAAEDVEIEVCRSVGQNERALKLLLGRVPGDAEVGRCGEEFIELVLTVAANAGRSKDALPLVKRWVAAQPAGAASWEELAAGKVKADAGFVRLADSLARQCEWTGQPEAALDWYLKLALLGDDYALRRAEELQKGLSRASEWCVLLEKIVPVAGHPEYTRQLARLLANEGEYDKAPVVYERWLKDNPGDVSALKELGAMYAEIPETGKALVVFEQAFALDGKDLGTRKEIAELRLVMKDFEGALTLYHSLPEEGHDGTSLENYSLLAESLGDYAACNRALLMRYHRLHDPLSKDFVELARSFELINQPDGAISTLTEGLRRLPGSRVLRTHLAQAWRNRGDFGKAMELLAVRDLKNDLQAVSLLIEVCCLAEDYQQALVFLGRGIEKKFAFPPDVRLDLGHIYFNNGYMTEADALYTSVPDEPSLWPLIANARFLRGDLAGAESYQRRYLTSIHTPDPQGWLLMGDILRAGGREAEAQQAYQKSLQMMEDKLDGSAVIAPAAPSAARNGATTAYNP